MGEDKMSIEHDIKKTALIIKKYLPKWNHSTAVCDLEKESFIRAVNQLDFQKEENDLWQDFANLIAEHVPDNHINLKRNGKNLVPKKVPNKRINTQNDIPENHEKFDMSEKGSWYIGTRKMNGQNIGIVTIAFLSYSENEKPDARKKFINRFFELKKEKNWKNIIFDLRGNTGGDAQVIKEITERMAGYTVKYADKTEVIIPNETDPYRHLFLKKHQESEIPSIITDEKTDRFSGSVYILQDGYNASASEGAIFMLKQLPKAKSIGEATSGTYQSGATVLLPVTEDTTLIMGTKYLERYDKKGNLIQEKKGMAPDIYTPASNAMARTLTLIKGRKNPFVQTLFLLSQLYSNLKKPKTRTGINNQNNQR